jgi:hypothetical protein
MRKLIVTAIAITASLILLAPTVARAQEPKLLSSVTILGAVVDTKTRNATVTVTVTCLMDIPEPGFVVGSATLTQTSGSGRSVSYLRKGIGDVPCQAGQALVFPIPFSGVGDGFLPGPANIYGFLEADLDCCLQADLSLIGPTTVTLRPA